MFSSPPALPRRNGLLRRSGLFRSGTMAVALALLATATVITQKATAEETPTGTETALGRIDLNYDGLPPATVEVDLSQGMFTDLFGIGDAAIAGVAEALTKAVGTNGAAEGTQLAAEQMAAARQIVEIASGVVHEVRVRVYQDLPSDEEQPVKLMAHFNEVIRSGSWETIVRAREEENTVSVSVARQDGAMRGLFVVAYDGDDFVLANIVCDISPENAKKLTSVATKIGLEAGLAQVIEAEMRQLRQKGKGPRAAIATPVSPAQPDGVVAPPAPIRPRKAPMPPVPSTPPVSELTE